MQFWGSWTQDITAAAKSLQSCRTLCDSIDGSPPGSPVPGVLQERTLEWVAMTRSTLFLPSGPWIELSQQLWVLSYIVNFPRQHHINQLWLRGKESTCSAGDWGSIPGSRRSPGEGNGNPPIFLPGKSHGQRSLVGYNPWGFNRTGHNWVTK